MLRTLRIKNLALVTDLTVEFQPGFNVITGETGAGKSIIIGALNLVLGERADRALIRSGSESCSVEAVFDVKKLLKPLGVLLEENGIEACDHDELLLKRTFSANGANRQFINGSPATLNLLANVGELLVDMHGPHDHQSLFHAARQLSILDAYGDLISLRQDFAKVLQGRAALQRDKSALIIDEKTYAQQLDLLRFQVGEISFAKLRTDEETEVEEEFQRCSNAAKLLQLSQTALAQLSEDESSTLVQAGSLGRSLHELQRTDAAAAPLVLLHEQAVAGLRDLQAELSRYAERIDLNPARLQEVEERLNLIQGLKRKYGATVAEIISFGEEAQKKLENLEQRDFELTRLNRELEKLDAELKRVGDELSRERRKIIPKLAKAVTKQIENLGFRQSKFDVAMQTNADFSEASPHFLPTGFDAVEFQFSPNIGEPLRPLSAVASSGEMSRVMLALKTVLASEDEIPVLVFDEIDANVGGETAQIVGEKMREIARQRQVLCITHLAPVAASASAHYVVTKKIEAGRTISEIVLLEKKRRVEEIARMLGGQSEASRKHAESLLPK